MARIRKWENSNIPIRSFVDLQMALYSYGGIWMETICGRLFNKAWVVNQQYNYLVRMISAGRFFFPKLTDHYISKNKRKSAK